MFAPFHWRRIYAVFWDAFSLNIFYFINAEKGLGISYFKIIYALSLQFTAGLYNALMVCSYNTHADL